MHPSGVLETFVTLWRSNVGQVEPKNDIKNLRVTKRAEGGYVASIRLYFHLARRREWIDQRRYEYGTETLIAVSKIEKQGTFIGNIAE